MKRQQAKAILNRFLEECGKAAPAQSEIEPVLDRVWERLEWKADDFVSARVPAAPVRPFRFVWVVGIVLAAVSVNVLVWRQGSVAVRTGKADERSFAKLLTEQAGETLEVSGSQEVFELASVKLVSPSSEAARRANTVEAFQLSAGVCAGSAGSVQLDPGRLRIPAATVLSLVMVAYGQDCTLVEGGPAWARSGDYYEINALLPAGTPSYKPQDLAKGTAPRLQRMLQNLLTDRFRLVLKRELREMSVYALTVAGRGKMTLSPDETRLAPASFPNPPGFPAPVLRRGQMLQLLTPAEVHMSGHAISLSDLAKALRQYAGRFVVDKTGVNDVFDVDLTFARNPDLSPLPPAVLPQSIPPLPEPAPVPGSPLPIALEEQLGLKLESTRMPLEFLVIESVERPSEN
jgi:uncharacterized protein (TIGR03435 family)